jgi:hypothetical protein
MLRKCRGKTDIWCLLQITMLVSGRSFDGSSRFLEGSRRMRSIVGNTLHFTTFHPVRFPHMEILYLSLESFFNRGIWCHLAGPFVAFLAGVLESFRSINVYVALTDHPLLNLIFQRVPVPIENFSVDAFDFELIYVDDEYDIFAYNVSFLDMNFEFNFYGIDSLNCGPDSIIDFINFAWRTFERYNFRKYAVALSPSDNNSEPPLMRCLRGYRSISDG